MDQPYERLRALCEKLRTPRPRPRNADFTRSPAARKGDRDKPRPGLQKFRVANYTGMQKWLERFIIKGDFDVFKQLVFLAPACF